MYSFFVCGESHINRECDSKTKVYHKLYIITMIAKSSISI